MHLTYCENLCIMDCAERAPFLYAAQQAASLAGGAVLSSFSSSTNVSSGGGAPDSASPFVAAASSVGNASFAYGGGVGGVGDPTAATNGSSSSLSSSLSSSSPSQLHVQTFLACLMSFCNFQVFPNETGEVLEAQRNFVANKTMPVQRPGNCSPDFQAFLLSNVMPAKYAVPMNGYIAPILVLLTLINNSLVCIVLLKPHMRSPTNAILVAMAISDILTGLFPTPVYVHFFATERFYEWVPYNWCYAYHAFADFIPTIFHTASIWLTMALAIQRYIYVCHSFKARTWCTVRNVVYGTIAIYVLSCLSHATRFFESTPVEFMMQSKLDPHKLVSACIMRYRPFVENNINVYFNIYYWYRVVLIHFVPCVSLVVMNALLIYAMKMAQIRRMQLLRQNKKTESRKLKESNCTTLMLVAVVGLFLLVEFPLAILIIFLILEHTFEVIIIEGDTFEVFSLISNFCILLSYPLNFFIYCGMSKQFRETFKRLFTGSDMPADKEYSQYMTLATENGKSTAVTAAAGDETAL